MDETYDLLTGEHFHVILHSNRTHGIIFNRIDKAVTTINYEDARDLSDVKLVGRIYGIVGRFLDNYLVLIKSRSKVGTLYDPNSKTNHDVYVITQVQVLELAVTNAGNDSTDSSRQASSSSDKNHDTSASSTRGQHHEENAGGREYPMTEMKTSESYSSLPVTINSNSYLSAQRSNNWNPFKLANSLKPMLPSQFFTPVESQTSTTNHHQSTTTNNLTNDNNNNNGNGNGNGNGNVVPGNQSATAAGQQRSSSATTAGESADKRLVEEMIKLFNNTNSFYYSPTLDLTNRFSRQNLVRTVGNEPIWMTANERFFWNKHMLKDLIELSKEDNDANYFICVILQGFIAIQQYSAATCRFTRDNVNNINNNITESTSGGINQSTSMNIITPTLNSISINTSITQDCDKEQALPSSSSNLNRDITSYPSSSASARANYLPKIYQLALVSRRSVFQAGTRYRRRGCDENGHVANFVETEQIFKSDEHYTSLVIIRGSIPLFWYQSGYNYRPPPVLTRSEEENHLAFAKHYRDLMSQYETEQIISIDCTEQLGREKVLHETFQRHMDILNGAHPRSRIIGFDYHKYCRGRQCTDAQIEQHMASCGLTEQTLKDIKYYWNDGEVVLQQEGVFRVNCLDCSDRTNVVQRIIALQILDLQLARLGIIAPDSSLEENECKRIMQLMWSNNGNILSTQYCGTRALFGSERKLSGYIKDTYSSASRYYMSKFRDVYRQAAIDAMLGVENLDTANNLESAPFAFKDQYELLSFDPILASRAGGAILKDVGSRVTNRLARLKGKFNNVRGPFSQLESPSSSSSAGAVLRNHQRQSRGGGGGIIETGLSEPMAEMSIDWPSSESVDKSPPSGLLINHHLIDTEEAREAHDVFACYANCDDSFQDDDEFGQLMLSIDVAELERLRQEEQNELRFGAGADLAVEMKEEEEKTQPKNQGNELTTTTIINADADNKKHTNN